MQEQSPSALPPVPEKIEVMAYGAQNRVVVFEQLNEKPQTTITFTDTPILETLNLPEN